MLPDQSWTGNIKFTLLTEWLQAGWWWWTAGGQESNESQYQVWSWHHHRSPISPPSTDTAHFPRMSFINDCGLINGNHAHISTYPLQSRHQEFHLIYWVQDDQARFQSLTRNVEYRALHCITLQVSKLIAWCSLMFVTDDLPVKLGILILILPAKNYSASSS